MFVGSDMLRALVEKSSHLGGGFKYVLFSPLLGEMIQFDEYFSTGLKPPTRHLLVNNI